MHDTPIICVVGLGYVGLPLAHAFGMSSLETYGYDVNAERIQELHNGHDRTNELTSKELQAANITYSADPTILKKANTIIVAIPTPVDDANVPDLTIVKAASKTIGQHMQKGSVIVYESTVYPGVTEDLCGPILEQESGMKCGIDFTLGYSPERINPGDKEHTIDKIVKVVGGQDEHTTAYLVDLYSQIITVGVHTAPSIKVAEMAKAIENAQRDMNIAYVNEIAMMCDKMGIRSKDVFDAAGTKWNFLRFSPGLVGGHCIGVDPYYLIHKAQELHMELPMVTASRKTNDGMAGYVATKIVDCMEEQGTNAHDATVLVLGLTFKENIPDTRNSKSQSVINALTLAGCTVIAHDPFAKNDVDVTTLKDIDAIALLVTHDEYCAMTPDDFAAIGKKRCVFYDLKSAYSPQALADAGLTPLSL